jgi:hypothetical protein
MTHYQQRVAHYYRKFRQHQMETYGDSGLYVDGVNQREFTGGGAWPGYHALAAYQSARSQVHFIDQLGADLAVSERRSKAAKRGWQKRRGN